MNVGRFDLLFECNTLEREEREKIWEQMTLDKRDGQPVPVNRCPLPPKDMVFSASMGIFAVSPPGTGKCLIDLSFESHAVGGMDGRMLEVDGGWMRLFHSLSGMNG